jgi:hypothetical protein
MIREMLGIAEGILQDLHNDHTEVNTLFGQIQDNESAGERKRLFEEMATKLLAHAHAEQEVLYSRLENGASEDSRKFALEGTSEHQMLEQQVGKIAALSDPISEMWMAELKVLQDLVEHHVGEEESTGFSCARHEFTTAELEAMRNEFQTRKAQLGTRVA